MADLELQSPPTGDLPAKQSNLDVRMIRLDNIFFDPRNPRRSMSDEGFDDLVDSINQYGVLEPVLVRPLPNSRLAGIGAEQYRLVGGSRRYRASEKLDLPLIPARIIHADSDEEALLLALVSNQHEAVKPMELAATYAQIIQGGRTVQWLADRLGLKQPEISKLLALQRLPDEVKVLIENGSLTRSHATPLCSISDDTDKVNELAERAVMEGWSTKRMEREVAALKNPAQASAPSPASPTLAMALDVQPGAAQLTGEPVTAGQIAAAAASDPSEADLDAAANAMYDEGEGDRDADYSARNNDANEETGEDGQSDAQQADQAETMAGAVVGAAAVDSADEDGSSDDNDGGAGSASTAESLVEEQPMASASAPTSTPSIPVQPPVSAVTPKTSAAANAPTATKSAAAKPAAQDAPAGDGVVMHPLSAAADDWLWEQNLLADGAIRELMTVRLTHAALNALIELMHRQEMRYQIKADERPETPLTLSSLLERFLVHRVSPNYHAANF